MLCSGVQCITVFQGSRVFLYFIIENYGVCEKILNLKFTIDQ